MEKKSISHFLVGLFIGCILVLINVLYIIFDLNSNIKISWIPSVINVGLLIYFIFQFGKSNDNTKTYGELFSYGFKASAINTLILTAFMLFYNFLFPESLDKVLETSREQMESNPKLNGDQIERTLDFTRKFYVPILIAGTLFSTIFVGAIGSLIGAAIAKKKPKSPF
jgi:hypothetical protein